MTAQETALIEAARTACVTALNACQTTLQVIEAVLGASDKTEPDKAGWDAFDTEDTTPTEQTNGRKKR